jgi:hypothetical protein
VRGWRPIATAPHGWVSILVYDRVSRRVGEAYHRDVGRGTWLWANTPPNDEESAVEQPTHWMPLPEPPLC